MAGAYKDLTDVQRQRFELLVLVAAVIRTADDINSPDAAVEEADKVIQAARAKVLAQEAEEQS